VSQIVIAGKDWQSRALLRAQLLEEGLDVEAYGSIPEALATLGPGTNLPTLLIADISASDDPTADVEALSVWSQKLPIWIIASRNYIVKEDLRSHGFESVMLRPVDMGGLLDQIKRRMERLT
jgi:CheY-like chemotaxis protein